MLELGRVQGLKLPLHGWAWSKPVGEGLPAVASWTASLTPFPSDLAQALTAGPARLSLVHSQG